MNVDNGVMADVNWWHGVIAISSVIAGITFVILVTALKVMGLI